MGLRTTDNLDTSDKPDKREQIMQAAEGLFASRRLHEITLDEVASRAGVGKGTIYLYFKDKDDLFFQTATAGFDEMCDLLRRTVPTESDFAGQLLGACRQITAFFEGRRQLFAMMQAEENRMAFFQGELRDRWLARRRRLIDALAGILRKGVGEGALRRDVPPETLAAFLLGMLRTQGRDLHELDGPGTSLVPPHRTVVDLFLHGAVGE
jgi:AcrR family transcriptional regulator